MLFDLNLKSFRSKKWSNVYQTSIGLDWIELHWLWLNSDTLFNICNGFYQFIILYSDMRIWMFTTCISIHNHHHHIDWNCYFLAEFEYFHNLTIQHKEQPLRAAMNGIIWKSHLTDIWSLITVANHKSYIADICNRKFSLEMQHANQNMVTKRFRFLWLNASRWRIFQTYDSNENESNSSENKLRFEVFWAHDKRWFYGTSFANQ